MKQKILTIFIIIITIFSNLVVFADEETTEETKLITITGNDSKEYTFVEYTGIKEGQCFLVYYPLSNYLQLHLFDNPISYTFDNENNKFTFTTLDGSTTNKRYTYQANFDTSLNYYKWNSNFSTTSFKDVSQELALQTKVFLAYYENTELLKNPSSEEPNPEPEQPIEPEPEEPEQPIEPEPEQPEQNENTADTTEINNNLTKIYTGIQFIVSFLSLGAVLLLVYIVYKLFLMFFAF